MVLVNVVLLVLLFENISTLDPDSLRNAVSDIFYKLESSYYALQ